MMDIQSASTKEKKGKKEWLAGLKKELKLISWPSKENLKKYTGTVLLSSFLFGFGIYLIDLLIRGSLHGLNYFLHGIFG